MTVDVNGLPVFFAEAGQGPCVLLLHGWGASQALFAPLMGFLAQKYRVLAPDFPGFGQSPEPPQPWDLDGYVAFVLAFLAALGEDECIVLGHSFGGRVAIKLAARRLQRPAIKKLVLVSAAGVKHAQSKQAIARGKRYQRGKKLLKPFPRAGEWWLQRHGSEDYRAASPRMRQVMNRTLAEDLAPLLGAIAVPTLLVWGRHDTATPLSDGQLMEAQIPGAGLVVLEGTHFAFLECQAQFLRVMGSFLNI